MAVAAIGLGTGIVGSVCLTHFLSGFLYDVKPTDLVTFMTAVVLLTGTALGRVLRSRAEGSTSGSAGGLARRVTRKQESRPSFKWLPCKKGWEQCSAFISVED